ncbi:3-phosphoshikimate 1-carboxyvinyltransferase [Aeropyrum pernix]|uniref:3-phosphoshikimate 1-carboxyvinyltransferase n=1 Tax=Aeropyrum pernix TaxID=56636 RepID=A0A401HA66_AERPX|nr:3-phosphoshikimate 1-carboxyvinyltransferase [Aeropyrum pernix]GBF09355.1 3-phosphoshikimate 1-carboxyvinyltransferase [Aeropyrum pernix]
MVWLRAPDRVVVHPSTVEGRVEAPPSKSYTHRMLFLALLARGRSVVRRPLVSNDTLATLNAVALLGGKPRLGRGVAEVEGGEVRGGAVVYAAGSGTTIRIAMGVAAHSAEATLLYGDESLNRRPVHPLSEALRSMGARVCDTGGNPPVKVSGPLRRASVEVDAAISSQFATSLLIAGSRLGEFELSAARLSSRGYVDITLESLSMFGVRVEREGYRIFRLKGTPEPVDAAVPGDYSSASFMLAAGAIAGRVEVEGLRPGDPQPDRRIVELLRSMGARVRVEGSIVAVESTGPLEPIDIDLDGSPDLAPVTAVLAAYARGVSRLRGLERLQYKESDRLSAIAWNLARLGVEARVRGGILEIRGGGVEGGVARSWGDHRIAMAMAVAGLGARRPVTVEGFSRVPDSYPGFLEDLARLGARFEVVKGGGV